MRIFREGRELSKPSFCPVCRASLPSDATVCGECRTPISKIGTQTSEHTTVGVVVRHRSPSLAAILSFFIPGLGQWYLRRWKSGAAWFFGSILLIFLIDGLLGAFSYFLSLDPTGPAVVAIIAGGLVIRIASAWNARKIAHQE